MHSLQTHYAIREEDLPIIFEQYDKLAKEIIKRKKAGNGFNFFHFMIDLKRWSLCGKEIIRLWFRM